MRPVKVSRASPHDAASIAMPEPSPSRPEEDTRAIAPLLLVVSDRPALFRGVRPEGYEVAFWQTADLLARLNDLDQESLGLEHRRRADDVVILLDVQDASNVDEMVERLHERAPRASALLLTDAPVPDLPDMIFRKLKWGELLQPDIELELAVLATRSRVRLLRDFAADSSVIPILIQRDPDPDAISSALAVRVLLQRKAAEAPIVSLGEITRPENHRMAELLHAQVRRITEAELRTHSRVIAVDMQPVTLKSGDTEFAVIDHHPREDGYATEFLDIRPQYGANATILTEYLRSEGDSLVPRSLATALLYGIKTDTASLSRGVIPADVTAYAFLQSRADMNLLARIEQPSYPRDIVHCFGRALENVQVDDDIAVAVLGELPADEVHVLPVLADFCLGIEEVNWVAAVAEIGDDLVIALRHFGPEPGAGELARALAGKEGSGGGPPTMARCTIPLEIARQRFGEIKNTGPEGQVFQAKLASEIRKRVSAF